MVPRLSLVTLLYSQQQCCDNSLSVVISFDPPTLQIGKLRLATPGPQALGTEFRCSSLHLVMAVFVYSSASLPEKLS